MRTVVSTLLLLIASAALAQIGLPAVRVPSVPGVTLPNVPAAGVLDIDKSAAVLAGEVDPRRLRELRALRVREQLRRHRDVLEADPHGAPMVRGEVLALSPSAAALQAAGAAGFSVLRESVSAELGTHVVVLHAARGTAHALARLQELDPAGVYDFNHVYTDSGAVGLAEPAAQPAPAPGAVARAPGAQGVSAIRVGLIDSGVDVTHEVFSGITVQQHGCARAVPAEHGTAVASLMVGRASALHGAAPGSALYAVDVFCGLPTGGAVDSVAEAFAWLVREQVPVINVSLVGPPNRTLAGIVQNVLARGHLVVAAVGNDGPAAPPLYPAAWPGVVGVTAVDARQQVLVEALRGAQVKFAAPGADMAAAGPHQGYALVRGTSFASPIVAGLLALELPTPDDSAAQQAVAALAARAVDLGTAGLDPVYGHGLVGADLRQQPALARLGAH